MCDYWMESIRVLASFSDDGARANEHVDDYSVLISRTHEP